MSQSGQKRPTLVADKRYPAKKAAPKKPARKTTTKRKAAPKRRGGGGGGPRKPRSIFMWPFVLIGWVFRLFWRLMWKGAVVTALIIGLAVFYFASTMPELNAMLDGRAKGSVTILDRYGEVYAWRGDQRGRTITTETVSPHLKNAVVATEDKRFYGHFGLSRAGLPVRCGLTCAKGAGLCPVTAARP